MSQLTDATSLELHIANLNPGRQYNIHITAITYHPFGVDIEGPSSNTVDANTTFAGGNSVSY